MKIATRWALALGALTFALFSVLDPGEIVRSGSPAPEAKARILRPATPLSFAGVARRTTRRMVRRTAIYASTLPAGCVPVVVNGTTLYRCGGAYYQPEGGQYVVVKVQ